MACALCPFDAAARRGRDPFTYQDGAVVRGSRATRQLALVFTGHEFAEGAEAILDALARHGAKASFFLTGDFLPTRVRAAGPADAGRGPLRRAALGPSLALLCVDSKERRTLRDKQTN